MKHILLTSICIYLFNIVTAQYVIRDGEKIECEEITMKSSLTGPVLIYKVKGKEFKLSGEECWHVPTVVSGDTYDLVPTNPDKPAGKGMYLKRIQDGVLRINVYEYLDQSEHTQKTTMVNTTTITVSEKSKYYVKMPDGKYYEITKSNYNDYILPVLLKCTAAVEEMKNNNTKKAFNVGDVINDTIIYNRVCAGS